MYLNAFSQLQHACAKQLLAHQVVHMMGRKIEEGDWSSVYCKAKGIPDDGGWSNLHIDVNHNGLGVEHKMLCVKPKQTILECCGTTLMHPSATRSIRVESTDVDPNQAMASIFQQYAALIADRTQAVRARSPRRTADMRTGWLLWERSLSEFLYFEEDMTAPDPRDYYAEWNQREAQGARKSSKNLWIYDAATGKKRYSVTTSAGAKIQPYFDVPSRSSKELNYFKVQGEEVTNGVQLWVSRSTVQELGSILHNHLDPLSLSTMIVNVSKRVEEQAGKIEPAELAVPLTIDIEAYKALLDTWGGISDEHRMQLLVKTLRKMQEHSL